MSSVRIVCVRTFHAGVPNVGIAWMLQRDLLRLIFLPGLTPGEIGLCDEHHLNSDSSASSPPRHEGNISENFRGASTETGIIWRLFVLWLKVCRRSNHICLLRSVLQRLTVPTSIPNRHRLSPKMFLTLSVVEREASTFSRPCRFWVLRPSVDHTWVYGISGRR